jgi:hypothetical protein
MSNEIDRIIEKLVADGVSTTPPENFLSMTNEQLKFLEQRTQLKNVSRYITDNGDGTMTFRRG